MLEQTLEIVREAPIVVQSVLGLLVLLSTAFIFAFVLPALMLSRRLNSVLQKLELPEFSGPVDLADAFEGDAVLKHLWAEFRETLHEERVRDPATGQLQVVALRATLPAEAFFHSAIIVDSRVRTEFFKHLPGIFTGIGIIGTFSGLIAGLRAFTVSDNPDEVRESLNALLGRVYEAFIVSAMAIGLAMLATLVEKMILVWLYGRVDRLTQAIDERFKAGVGEEYLSRLVGATEETASQSKILKDALVEDLKDILTELTDKQIEAANQGQVQLGRQITESLGEGLRQPIEQIAAAVNQVGQDQGTAVQTLLADVLASFSQKLEEMFGNQLTGIHDMQQQTVAAMGAAIEKLESAATSMEGAGERATEAMALQLSEALETMNARNADMNQEMREFVSQIRELVGKSQEETSKHLAGMLEQLSEQTGGAVQQLREQSQTHTDAMSTQLEELLRAVGESTAKTSSVVERLEAVTSEAVGKLNGSAETLAIAADDFATAGRGVENVLTRAETLAQQLSQSATSVAQATKSLDELLGDYRSMRDAVSAMLNTVQETVERARREASLTEELVQKLEQSAGRLSEAQTAADEYLEGVTDVLGSAHEAFAENIQRTLATSNTEFYEALSSATALLREAIAELEASLGSLPAR